MKSLVKSFIVVATILLHLPLLGQDACNPFFAFEEGRKWTVSSYNSKDKFTGKQVNEVLALNKDGANLTATVGITTYDKKNNIVKMDKDGAKIERLEVEFMCNNGKVTMDMSSFFPKEMLESFKSMEVQIDIDELTIPKDLKVGQKLEDGGIKIQINGPMKMNLNVMIVDRMVASQEKITVPAGTFDTYKVTSTVKMTGLGNREAKNVTYLAEKVGFVRSEDYNDKGNLISYSVLDMTTE